jgi:hypothetical protein
MLKLRNSLAKPLTIMQANIRKEVTLHKIMLLLINNSFVDIILIQEPYIFLDCTRKILKAHFIYKSFTLLDN